MEGFILEYTYLGRTGLRVSRLCLGTMNFGVDTDEKEAKEEKEKKAIEVTKLKEGV